MQRRGRAFDVGRLVDPSANAVLELDADGTLHRTGERCAAFWDTDSSCANCISSRAFAEHPTLNKLEFTRNEMYFVIARYVSVNGTPCVLEMVSRLSEGRWIDANGSRFLLDRTRGEDMQLFLDPLTNVYSRRYFETYRTHLEGMEGVALIDVNNFKLINDRCGHAAGEAASLTAIQTLVANAPETPDGDDLARAVVAANHAVIRAAAEGSGRKGMGTTMTCAMLSGKRLVVAQVGDSRAYLLHECTLIRVTREHSYVE